MNLWIWAIVGVVIFAVVAIIRISSEKQKIAIRLLLILFTFFIVTAAYVGIKSGADLKNFDSLTMLLKVYFNWISTIGKNIIGVTGYAIHQDWSLNVTNATG